MKLPPLVYGYSNARARGLKGAMLKKDFFDELLNVRTIDGMVELLQRTYYKNDLIEASIRYKGSRLIESGCARYYVKVAEKIRKMTPKDDVQVINSFLLKWDLLNLKTILQYKKRAFPFQEIKHRLVPAGSLDFYALSKIYEADEKELVSEIRRTKFGNDLFSQSMQGFTPGLWKNLKSGIRNLDNISQAQTMLDASSFLLIKAAFDPHIKSSPDAKSIFKIINKEIDMKNILIVERMKTHGVKEQEKITSRLMKGGRLNQDLLSSLISATDLKTSTNVLGNFIHHLKTSEVDSLVGLEIALEKAITQEKIKIFMKSVFSVGTLIGFLMLMEEEIGNIRKIAKGKEYGISNDKIRNTLVMVN